MATLHIDTELFKLKNSLQEMWLLVDKQLTKAQIAFMEYDKAIAREILSREKMVNALELKIDQECENFIARNNPVAIDLRLALAYIKINNNLERIGDFAEGIAEFVLRNMSEKLPQEFAEKLRIEEMFNGVSEMFTLAKESLHEENSSKAEKIFGLDNLVDEINHRSNTIITEEMKKHPEKIEEYLYLNAVIRKLERMGDRCNNIAEEIVFYLDAKILKHNKSV
ncbi:MAG TPA: phosphate transport system regulatory protein PhoU [Bacteroidales bacterium]|nr:phosphate transport system regulatory protein PhoU [Bacteroidales bacterium]